MRKTSGIKEGILTEINEESIEKFAAKVAEQIRFGSNMRAGAVYRRIVCQVLVKRALHTIVAENKWRGGKVLMEVTITLNGKRSQIRWMPIWCSLILQKT